MKFLSPACQSANNRIYTCATSARACRLACWPAPWFAHAHNKSQTTRLLQVDTVATQILSSLNLCFATKSRGRMSGGKPQNNDPTQSGNRLQSGADLHAWRIRMAISAKALATLIGVTERSVHRAEQSAKLGDKVKLAMELLQSRLAHGEIDLNPALRAPSRRGRPRKEETPIFAKKHQPLRFTLAWRTPYGSRSPSLAQIGRFVSKGGGRLTRYDSNQRSAGGAK